MKKKLIAVAIATALLSACEGAGPKKELPYIKGNAYHVESEVDGFWVTEWAPASNPNYRCVAAEGYVELGVACYPVAEEKK